MQTIDVPQAPPFGGRRNGVERTLSAMGTSDIHSRANSERATEHRLWASEERFRAFVTATSDVVYSMSPDWREMRYLVGKDFIVDTTDPSRTWLERYIPAQDQALVLATIAAAIRGKGMFALEHRVIRADGSVGWTFSRAIPLMNDAGEIVEWFGAARDVTERRSREAALREADQRKDEFIATLGHELRNPLSSMANAMELLRLSKSDDPFQQKAHAILDRQLAALKRLVDDLLEIGRITSGQLTLRTEPLQLTAVIERAIETVRPLIEQRKQILTVLAPQSIELVADELRLQQVVVNLLNNAAKYTDEGGRIDVSSYVERDEAVVSVKDTGIGIEPELLPQLFQSFTQSKRTLGRSDGGLGLGLSIARRLVEMHAGTIDVRSTVGQGSEFIVRLPLKGAPSD